MKHASLFSGIGGFDLAAEWMGWENVFHCEWNPFGQKILKYYWPKAISYEDITKTDFTIHRGEINILTGGFPCQPYSVAGKRLGKEDERHLWPEMLRAIREIQPCYVVGENVSGIINWGGGLVFEEVQVDLENQGYQVQPFILPACGVDAPHRRDRVWFVAYRDDTRSDSSRSRINNGEKEENKGRKNESFVRISGYGIHENSTDTNGASEQRKHIVKKRERKFNRQNCGVGFNDFQNFPTQSPICDGNDGISSRLDGITFPKWRNESIKGGGNAIVPQVALEIFKAIEKMRKI